MKKHHLTSQRMAIDEYLTGNKSHPSVGEIYEAVSKKTKKISLATVYNTLQMMKKYNLIRELPTGGKLSARFDPDVTLHHHLICRECGAVADIQIARQAEISEEQRQGFDIDEMSVIIYGICPGCKSKTEKQGTNIKR
ncbi:MAG TPA: transcriptional repressor [Smithella sp.]|nr:transcriptional repressor [Smithella sp.]MDM7986056.1 transcriptional repressor [Smithella sp.]HNY50753.1 transcriptional repressor [Smithella sp.]HOG90318.1 transcriptional repressor [Smithella sp.]HQG65684.1 transcriptional repressor [Smithella sp.]